MTKRKINLDSTEFKFLSCFHSIFQHRCVSIFTDKKTNSPTGFALGSIEGRVAIHYVNPQNPKDNFTFKCHRSNGATNGVQDIFAVSLFQSLILFEFILYPEPKRIFFAPDAFIGEFTVDYLR